MLTENFLAATAATTGHTNVPNTLKDIGIIFHEFLPRNIIRQSFKKSSAKVNCVAVSNNHVFAAQADKAVVHVYNRERGNQEATVAFPERVHSLAFVGESAGFLVLGTEGGRLTLWDVGSGRQCISTASHLHPVSCLSVLPGDNIVLSGSSDSSVHVWSLPKMISFTQSRSLVSDESAPNSPSRTFANHRSGITALACGHSKVASNFAASASEDGTCYIWSTSDCAILRTILFPLAPRCFVVDPADRAIYSGHENGSVQCVDLYKVSREHQSHHLRDPSYPVQLNAENGRSPQSENIGSVQCLTLSYDGSTLLSGHASGKICPWDIAQRRGGKSIVEMGHSVTNIHMLRPEGLPSKRPRIEVKTVVKPKMDAPVPTSNRKGATAVPADYSVRVHLTSTQHKPACLHPPPNRTEFSTLLNQSTLPNHLIDEAVLDFSLPPQDTLDTIPFPPETNDEPPSADPQLMSQLQSRISTLEENLSIFVSATERSRARRLERMARRDEYGKRKREAYMEAAGRGEDGGRDEEMKGWEEKEMDVDRESDEVELGDGVEVYGDV